MALVGSLILTAGFFLLMKFCGLVQRSGHVFRIAKSALDVVADRHTDDLQKEKALQQHAKSLFVQFFWIASGSALALGLPMAAVGALALAGLLSMREVMQVTLSWQFIGAILAASGMYLWVIRPKPSGRDISPYSNLEKKLHTLAFASWPTQLMLSRLEDCVFQSTLASLRIHQPVFITALPRAGTTLLLELCVNTHAFVSHTYRDMPFLATPILWQRFSSHFRRVGIDRQRAHGDGITINVDSPEAFEEILWKAFWPSRYRKNCIVPWSTPTYPQFQVFLARHLKKILLVRGHGDTQVRYISKNNFNIARIGYLRKVFPDAVIVVPFRDPLQHASSLQRQHKNFLLIHQQDPFASRYMFDIGHFDFGNNLKPIDYNAWISSAPSMDASQLAFWLQYWIQTYRYLLDTADEDVAFLSYDRFCRSPKQGLHALGQCLALAQPTKLLAQWQSVKAPKPYTVSCQDLPPDLVDQAEALATNLRDRSLL